MHSGFQPVDISTGCIRSKKEWKFAVFGTVVVLGTTSVEYGESCLLKGVKRYVLPPYKLIILNVTL